MKLFKRIRREDFGVEHILQFLTFRLKDSDWSVIQLSLSWNDYPAFPYLQITFGSNGLLCILGWMYRFGFDLSLFSRTWSDYNKYDELFE